MSCSLKVNEGKHLRQHFAFCLFIEILIQMLEFFHHMEAETIILQLMIEILEEASI